MFTGQPSRKLRPPAVAGSFYPRAPKDLEATVERLLSGTATRALGDLNGVIAPHAGYMYSGAIAGSAFASLVDPQRRFQRVLLIGPPHYVAVSGIAAPSARAFATPLGEVPLDMQAIGALEEEGLVHIDDLPHAPEHALEVELPFFQTALESFSIVPLLVGVTAPEHVAKIIERLIDGRTLLVVSTDLSHYLDDAAARKRDVATAQTIEQLDCTRLGPSDACGFSALNGTLCAASQLGWTIKRLDLRNSGDTSGERTRVVGYGAWALSS